VASPLLPSPPRSLSTAALSTTAREIAALIAAGDLEASVKHAKQFLFFEAGRASEEVPSLYRAVVSAAAAPRGKPSDSDHLSAAASALVEASMGAALPDGALRLLEDLIDTPGAPLPSGPSCDLLMENLLVLRCHAHVRRVFGILAAAGERPGAAAWNCVVRACAMEGDLDEALLKLRRMRRRRDGGVPPGPDAHTCAAVITALWMGEGGADAVKVFDEMAGMGVAPDRSTFSAMLCGYLKMEDLEAASELRTRMMREGHESLPPQAAAACTMEAVHCHDGRLLEDG
jgi:pentatricopeptide repeat protein